MWLYFAMLFVILFIIEEKVKHRVWQPVLFFGTCILAACILTYEPRWMDFFI